MTDEEIGEISLLCWENRHRESVALEDSSTAGKSLFFRPDTDLMYELELNGVMKQSGAYRADMREIRREGSSNDFRVPVPFIQFVTSLRGGQTDFSVLLGESELREEKGKLIEILQLVDPNVTDIVAIARQPGSVEIYVKLGTDIVPLAMAGGGLRNIAMMALYVLNGRGGVVLIDEIENGIFYRAYGKLWKAIADLARFTGTQVVATTHSYEFARYAACALDGVLDDFCFYRVERHEDSHDVVRYSGEELFDATDLRVEVR